jgi:hypothetical protein
MAIITSKRLSADTTTATTTTKSSFDLGALGTSLVNTILGVVKDQSTAYINEQRAAQELELARLGYEGAALQKELELKLESLGITRAEQEAAASKTRLINTILIGVFGAAMIGGGIYVVKTVNKSKKRR